MPCPQPRALAWAALVAASASPAFAFTPGQGKLLLTGGVSSIDGAAGGGLTPWAVTGSHATGSEIGATAFFTRTIRISTTVATIASTCITGKAHRPKV